MFHNFEDLKKQLQELSEIINSFKSEAVQLKIIELIFNVTPAHSGGKEGSVSNRKPNLKRKTTSLKKSNNPETESKAKITRKKGAAVLLNELIAEGYFETKRGINDIINFCSTKKASTLKQGDFASKLTRFVRGGKLLRERNSEGQYEYYTE